MASDEEEEEILVHVDFDSVLENDLFNKPNLFFKVIGIDSDKPVMQIEDQVFVGEYRDVPGTTLFFEDDLNPVQEDPVFGKHIPKPLKYTCKTRKSLLMRRIFVKKKDPTTFSLQPDDESLTDEEELPEADQFPHSPSCSLNDKNCSDHGFKKTPESRKHYMHGIIDTKYKKKMGHVKRRPVLTKVKKTTFRPKTREKGSSAVGEESPHSISSPEPIAGPSWLPDDVPQVSTEMLVEEEPIAPDSEILEREGGPIVKKNRKLSSKEVKAFPDPKEKPDEFMEKFVCSVDSAVLKGTGLTLTPDKTRIQKPSDLVIEADRPSTSTGEVLEGFSKSHVSSEEMSRLVEQQMILQCSSDSQKNVSGGRQLDM